MRKFSLISISLFIWIILGWLGQIEIASAATTPGKAGSIDVAATGPKLETEPIEINSNVNLEAGTRQKDYMLEPLPSNAPLPKLEFVSPGAGGSGYAAKITAQPGQAGVLTRTILVDKGERMTFSVNIRAEGISSVELVAIPVPRRPRGTQRPQAPGAASPSPRRGQGTQRPQAPGAASPRRGQGTQRPQTPDAESPRRARGTQAPSAAADRSKTLSGSFGWTTLSLDFSFTGNIDEGAFQVVIQGPGTVWIDDFSVKTHWPKVVDIPKKPVAPLLFMVLMHSETPQAYITNRDYFKADATKYEEMAKMLNRYGAQLVVEPEREIWLGAQKYDPDFIRRLHEKYGASFSVHTHGPRGNPTRQEVLDYVKLRKDEMEAMGSGPVTDLNGNFDQTDWDMFAEVGMRTMTAYKNTRTQTAEMSMEHYYNHPWRPAGSPYQGEEQWARHRPECRVVYIPGASAVHTRHHERFPDLMERHLRLALSRVRADRINVFYFVEHVGRFVTKEPNRTPLEYVNSQAFRDDMELHEKVHRDFVAPLVKSGHICYVTPSEVCDMFEQWEQKMGIAAGR